MSDGIGFLKGHGTENDFVLIPDPSGLLQISAGQVRAICDRRAGLGADGVIRVAPGESGRWFMDYHNADGSVAEMCGNGARLFARYLVDAGWAAPGRWEFDTRGGIRTAELDRQGDVRIGMGPVTLGSTSTARVGAVSYPGRQVDVGNPHLACVLDHPAAAASDNPLAALDLTAEPAFDHQLFPTGVNIEFVTVQSPTAVTMRVHERGVGETRSCGTGTVAAAAAALAAIGQSAGVVAVSVPGGRVWVEITGGTGFLTGPAVVVASGEIDAGLWATAA